MTQQLFKVVFTFSLILLFFLSYGLYEKQVGKKQILNTSVYPQGKKKVLSSEDQKTNPGIPVRLKIPSINVDAAIQYVGVTTLGAMEVPNNTIDVGWFRLGPRPGEKGNAVIAGHFDSADDKTGVFTNLNKLKEGNKLYIEDGTGTIITFVVRETRTYNPGFADDVFSASSSAHLNLITCDGVWDVTKKSYSKRLVVFADRVFNKL